MNVARKEVEANVRRVLLDNANNKDWQIEKRRYLNETYGLPSIVSLDLLTKLGSMETLDDQMFYCLVDAVIGSRYFTKHEMLVYGGYTYKEHELTMPLKFKCINLGDDIFFVSSTAKELEKFSKAKMVRYNEKTQRPMKLKNGFYQIQVKSSAVKSITNLLNEGNFIPNFITFNIPEDAEWEYDSVNGQLIFNAISSFDIIDGYHRWVAIMRCLQVDDNFDYPIGIQFVSFSEEKAKQFIWQADQNTKLSIVDSKALNQKSPSNQIVAMLRRGILNGDQLYGDQYMAAAVNAFFVNNDKSLKKSDMVTIRNTIYDYIEELSFKNPQILEDVWSISFTYVVVAAAKAQSRMTYKELLKVSEKFKNKSRYKTKEFDDMFKEVSGNE